MKRFQVGPARLRNGREARIYALDGGETRPIHGAHLLDGEWLVQAWRADGRCSDYAECGLDLLPNATPFVSDAALDAFYKARGGIGRSSPRDGLDERNAAGLAAAFAVMLSEQGE